MVRSTCAIDATMLESVRHYLDQCHHHTQQPPDEKSWRDFYDVCDPTIRRFVIATGLQASEVEDVVQEVWMHLLRRLPSFRLDPQRGRFQTWLYTIVHSKTIDRMRSRARQRRLAGRLAPTVGEEDRSARSDPTEQADTLAASAQVMKTLRRTVSPPNCRLVCLRWLDGQSVRDVARTMGLTPEQVWYREHRVKKKLRRMLSND